jgi:hypothetical protein
VRIADTLRDRTGVDVAKVDQPAFLAVIDGSAAGEGGHAALKRRRERLANRPMDWAWHASEPLPLAGRRDRAPWDIATMIDRRNPQEGAGTRLNPMLRDQNCATVPE